MIRVAAVGDLHAGADSVGMLRPHFKHLHERADVLLLAGDLTKRGDPDEAAVLVEELSDVPVPIVAVLGNHDYHCDRVDEIVAVLERGGVRVLEGSSVVLEVGGRTVGIAGAKGFGGGFVGAGATDFGEPEMKAFVRHTKAIAARLELALGALDVDVRIALLHYAPVQDTLRGERPEVVPFLGSYMLAEAVDVGGAHLALHGHAHLGTEQGVTPGGVHVRNVAQPVIKRAYNVYCVDRDADTSPPGVRILAPTSDERPQA